MPNAIKTTLLLGLLTGLIVWFGGQFGGQGGMMIALVFAGVMNLGAYWFSDKVVLSMYRASEIDPAQAPGLFRMVERLSHQAGLPMPRVYIIPSQSPNAFATGRNPEHAVVAVTEGLLRLMNDEELEGVLAHELGHVKNRDILIGSIAATLAGAVMMLANMAKWGAIFGGFGGRDDDEGASGILGLLFMSILTPIAAMLIQAAISRTREYKADAAAANIVGSPYGLARALDKLGRGSRQMPLEANPATSHLFIVNPLSGSGFINMLSTHPPIEDRIKRLLGRS